MWRVFNLATTYRVRPSEILGIEDDPYTAFCVDEAVATWGAHVRSELEEAQREKPKGKQASKDAARKRSIEGALKQTIRRLGLAGKDEDQRPKGVPYFEKG